MLKIALIDLNHKTLGIHNNTVPLGLGLISKYLQSTVEDEFDIRIYKDIDNILRDLESWVPDVLGLAQYVWNSELNLSVARRVKRESSNCLVVAGGPNLEVSDLAKKNYLIENKCVDICVSYDGEIPFAELVKKLLAKKTISEIKKDLTPGTYALDTESQEILASNELPPRLKSLDTFGSIYADGFFDDFLDDGFQPFVQTHRGCPFACTFCHTSNSYYSRMIFQSPEVFIKDMEYLGKRFAKKETVLLYLANTNMSLFKEDFKIAQVIRDVQDKYEWPFSISVNSGKDPKKLVDMLSILNFLPNIALQTLTPQVLKNISRINIPFDKFIEFQKSVLRKTGKVSGTELILSLPGETKSSFKKTLSTVLNSDVQNIVIYTLMNLKGTPASTEEVCRKYGNVIKHRVVPLQFSDLKEENVIETEEVVVGTNSMPYEDYLELRGLTFVIKIFFSSAELVPLKRFMSDQGVDFAQWVSNIQDALPEYPEIYKVYKAFLQETEEELFDSREELLEFFSNTENWNNLKSGELGQNLMRKNMMEILYENFDDYVIIAVAEAQKLITESSTKASEKETAAILKDMKTFLLTRNCKKIIEEKLYQEGVNKQLQFEIPQWLDTNQPLSEVARSQDYEVALSNKATEWINDFSTLNKGQTLSLQNLYHQYGIENLWPTWKALK